MSGALANFLISLERAVDLSLDRQSLSTSVFCLLFCKLTVAKSRKPAILCCNSYQMRRDKK